MRASEVRPLSPVEALATLPAAVELPGALADEVELVVVFEFAKEDVVGAVKGALGVLVVDA